MPISSQEIIVYIDTNKCQLMLYCLCYCLIKQLTVIIDHLLYVKMTLWVIQKTKLLTSKGFNWENTKNKHIKKIQAENS